MSPWQMFFFGGGKCPNLGVVNVRILGVVNVLLANDSQSSDHLYEGSFCKVQTLRYSRHETRKYETPLIYLLSEMYFEAAPYIVYAEP